MERIQPWWGAWKLQNVALGVGKSGESSSSRTTSPAAAVGRRDADGDYPSIRAETEAMRQAG